MGANSPLRLRLVHGAGLVAAALLAAVFMAVGPVAAQGYGWFGGFFEGRPSNPYGGSDYAPGYGYGGPSLPYAPRRRVQRKRQPVSPVEQAQDPAPKPKPRTDSPTVFVYVFGDSLGQLLANGLDDALSDKTEVQVTHMARGPSGLVNDAYYDWPKAIDDVLARQDRPSATKADQTKADQTKADQTKPTQSRPTQKIDVAVMMVGSNDRQPIVQDGKKLQPGSDEWNAVYKKRALEIAEAFQKKRIPLIWVGVPIVKNDDFADDMAALNEIYRDVAARTGATYVDTWEPFSDANGEFAAYGPDVNGQTVRLRTAEGIFFTKAGSRKLAHFVESQIRRDLDGKAPLPQLPTAAAPVPATKDAKGPPSKGGAPVVVFVKPEAGPIKNLGEPPAAKDGRLTDVSQVKPEATRDAVVANSLIKGEPDPAPAGRADNFRWPADAAATGAPAR